MYIDDNNNADTNIGAVLDLLWTVIYGIWIHDLCDTGAALKCKSEKYWETYNNDNLDHTKIPKFCFNGEQIVYKGHV